MPLSFSVQLLPSPGHPPFLPPSTGRRGLQHSWGRPGQPPPQLSQPFSAECTEQPSRAQTRPGRACLNPLCSPISPRTPPTQFSPRSPRSSLVTCSPRTAAAPGSGGTERPGCRRLGRCGPRPRDAPPLPGELGAGFQLPPRERPPPPRTLAALSHPSGPARVDDGRSGSPPPDPATLPSPRGGNPDSTGVSCVQRAAFAHSSALRRPRVRGFRGEAR